MVALFCLVGWQLGTLNGDRDAVHVAVGQNVSSRVCLYTYYILLRVLITAESDSCTAS